MINQKEDGGDIKKMRLTIDIHSVLDVITNSSSELFMISDSNVDTVVEMLEFMVDQWNIMARKGVFGEWYVKNNRVSLARDHNPKPIKTFDQIFGSIHVYTQEMFEHDKSYNGLHGWGYETQEHVGKIVIESETDNSIPSEIMEWIESAFSAKRWHLG